MIKRNKAEVLALIIAPSITGCISSVASLTLIVSILRSNQKLTTVYCRLIFSLSLFDILQSICQALSSTPMPAGTQLGAIGNETTCNLQGFFNVLGMCGTGLYTLSLTVYFLLVAKFEISEVKIKKFAEPFLHAIPLLYSFIVSIYIYATNNYTALDRSCWIGPKPLNCEDDPEVECLSGGNSYTLMLIVNIIPVFFVFVINYIILAMIWCHLRSRIRKNQAYGNLHLTSRDEENTTLAGSQCCSCCPTKLICHISSHIPQSNTSTSSVLADYLSRPSRTSIRRLREIFNRAIAYIIAFLLIFIFGIINHLFDAHRVDSTPFVILFLSRVFFPLQGLFNILIYTYPHVTSYLRNHSDHNWIRAFWEVIKSGGDSDQPMIGRRESLRKQQRVLGQSEQRRKSSVGSLMPISN